MLSVGVIMIFKINNVLFIKFLYSIEIISKRKEYIIIYNLGIRFGIFK